MVWNLGFHWLNACSSGVCVCPSPALQWPGLFPPAESVFQPVRLNHSNASGICCKYWPACISTMIVYDGLLLHWLSCVNGWNQSLWDVRGDCNRTQYKYWSIFIDLKMCFLLSMNPSCFVNTASLGGKCQGYHSSHQSLL